MIRPRNFVVAMLMVAILAVAMLAGCSTLKSAFCSPTADQIMAAADKLSQATGTLAFLQGLLPVPAVTAAIAALQIAIPILQQIKDGICVSAADEANANQVAVTSVTLAAGLGYRGAK